MKKITSARLIILGMLLTMNSFAQTNPPQQTKEAIFSTETIQREESGNKCIITFKNGDKTTIDWKNSPCERLYGTIRI